MSGERSGLVWLDGKIVDVKDARVPILDHGLLLSLIHI